MESFSATREIEEVDSVSHGSRSSSTLGINANERRSPGIPMANRSFADEEINKLFESISQRSSARGSTSSYQGDACQNLSIIAMKKSIAAGMPQSPRISGEQVSLKQALRDLCISKASEMAAMKRSFKSCGSPGTSEAGRIQILYDLVVDSNQNSHPVGRFKGDKLGSPDCKKYENKIPFHQNVSRMNNLRKSLDLNSTSMFQISSSTSLSTHSSPRFMNQNSKYGSGSSWLRPESASEGRNFQGKTIKSLNQITLPSPRFDVPRVCDELDTSLKKSQPSKNGDNPSKQNDETQGIKVTKSEVTVNEMHNVSKSLVADKSGNKKQISDVPKRTSGKVSGQKTCKKNRVRLRKGRVVRPVLKKPQQNLSSGVVDSKKKNEIHTISEHMVCQKCQCAIKNLDDEDSPVSLTISDGIEASTSNDCSDSGNQNLCSYNVARSVGKTKKNLKSKGKGELSQSSKSSLGEFSTSTSNSEESSTSRPSCGNKPHMSKDIRWEAIRHMKIRDGYLSLKHFNLLKKLGCGDIGTVYLAELIGSHCLFAIKVMDNEFLARRKKMPRAHTEREILRILDHPFLPTLYAQFTSDNLSCLVMEYCPGGDLHVLRQKQPGRCFPEPAARFYVAEVLLALEYLHMLGIIYRDLKPENILVREDGHIMLTDFDLSLTCNVNPTLLASNVVNSDSRSHSGPCTGSNCIQPFCIKPVCRVPCFSPRLLPPANSRKQKSEASAQIKSFPQLVAEPTDARSNSFVGTHEYLAPEIIKGDGHGAAVDWWTFGIFLYELLYGRTPFKGCGNEETLVNVVLQNLTFPDIPLVSFQARDLIRRLLVKEPENRLGSEKGAAEIKLHPFFEGLNWALIRCTIPPETPDCYDFGVPRMPSQEKNTKLMACKTTGDHLEFELF